MKELKIMSDSLSMRNQSGGLQLSDRKYATFVSSTNNKFLGTAGGVDKSKSPI